MSPAQPRVLICDDEPDIRTVVGLNLRLVGMDFGEAADGNELLETFDKGQWDALVLDLMMPNSDGFEVLERLKAREESDLTIIVLSAHHSPPAAIKALQLGAHAHLTKPFSPVAVAQMLDELIGMTPAQREARRLDAIERATTLERIGMPTV